MKQKESVLIAIICFFFLWSPFMASGTEMKTSKTTLQELEACGKIIRDFEAVIIRIEDRKLISAEDCDEYNGLMDQYAEKTEAIHARVTGDSDQMKKFVETLKAHQKRWTLLESRVKSIENLGKSAQVILERSLLQRMSSTELADYKEFLTPDGLAKMERLYPEIFKRGTDQAPSFALAEDTSIENQSFPPRGPSLGEEPGFTFGSSSAAGSCGSNYDKCKQFCKTNWFPGCRLGCLLIYIVCYIAANA